MTQHQIALVEDSWDFILIDPIDAGMIFYNKLFELDPSVRPLFTGDIRSQSEKLVSLITFVVHKLHTLDEIIDDVRALGERHKGYGVKPDHYQTLGTALLWTLEHKLGTLWTDETREAWITVYDILSKTMTSTQESAHGISVIR